MDSNESSRISGRVIRSAPRRGASLGSGRAIWVVSLEERVEVVRRLMVEEMMEDQAALPVAEREIERTRKQRKG